MSVLLPFIIGGAVNGATFSLAGSLVFNSLAGVLSGILGPNQLIDYVSAGAAGAVALWVGEEAMLMSYASGHKGALPTGKFFYGPEGGYLGPGYGNLVTPVSS